MTGFAVGMLTMVIPLYISELSQPDIRGGLVVLQQLSITIGILASFWIDYGTHYIGGTRCAPEIPYTGGTADLRTFNPYKDIGPNGCSGQSEASWRIPLALQIAPALILGGGMFFYPDTPRWLLAQERDEEAFSTLSKLRGLAPDHPEIVAEVLDVKAAIILENTIVKENHPGLSGVKLHAAQVCGIPRKLGPRLANSASPIVSLTIDRQIKVP